MQKGGEFTGVDWGALRRRIYRVSAQGTVLQCQADDHGVLNIPADHFAAEVAGIRTLHRSSPLLLTGLIGSERGWIEVPCIPAPCSLADLAEATMRAEEDVLLVPGVSRKDPENRADVMRGEAVTMLGAMAAGLAPINGVICHAGLHSRWARIAEGRIVDFTTCMTGELFALMRGHSMLGPLLTTPVEDGPAFRRGLGEAERGDLLGSLFGARAGVLLGTIQRNDAAAWLSGLLIGTEARSRLSACGGTTIAIAGEAHLASLLAIAIGHFGGGAVVLDSHKAFVAGLRELWFRIG